MKIICFDSILETILKGVPKDFPIILIGDFNIDMLKKNLNQKHFKTSWTNTN
jgi:hypothetical protein